MNRLKLVAAFILVTGLYSQEVLAASTSDTLDLLRGKLSDALPKDIGTALLPNEAEEIAEGREVAASLLALAAPVNNPELQAYVNATGRWIASHSERPDLPWHFVVIDTPDLNAFAVPGGYILLTAGLYQSLADPAELAGVLAHEIAHVVARHHLKATLSNRLVTEGSRQLGKQLKQGDNALTRNLLGAGASLLSSKLDQSSEFEADRMAVVLASRAGFDPYGLPSVLHHFEEFASSDNRVSMLFSTHPQPQVRLRQLDAAMADRFADITIGNLTGQLPPL